MLITSQWKFQCFCFSNISGKITCSDHPVKFCDVKLVEHHFYGSYINAVTKTNVNGSFRLENIYNKYNERDKISSMILEVSYSFDNGPHR